MAYWPEPKRRPLGEWLMIAAFLLGLGAFVLLIIASWSNCAHGHHEGPCGRQYKAGKLQILKVCECVKDHY